ncbi:hypothetical protein [Roseovarius albus]|uniref:hypothetical protein n=1 Tax=Roseovarius albus TaxID=1247867 RepID=UPI001356452E|nr:hypothetical protein [Roseovarius albus]
MAGVYSERTNIALPQIEFIVDAFRVTLNASLEKPKLLFFAIGLVSGTCPTDVFKRSIKELDRKLHLIEPEKDGDPAP